MTGGFVTTIAGVRVSARSPETPFLLAVAALAAWATLARRDITAAARADLAAGARWLDRHARLLVLVIASAAAATALAFNSFSAGGSDASGYLSQARMLLEGRLGYTEPLASLARWSGGEATLAPLGWHAAGDGLQVPTYAPGLPLLLAPAHALWGVAGAALVVAASLFVSINATAAIAERLAGSVAAVLAATWLATSPIALVESMQVMSDVPVTAAWLLCWWCAFRRLSLAAGLCGALAVLIRPNLAPLAAVPALFLLHSLAFRGSAGQRPRIGVLAFVSFALPVLGAAFIVAWLQWTWFGSPWRSGYGTAAEIYAAGNVLPNLRLYGMWLLQTHGPWLLLAPLVVWVLPRHAMDRPATARAETLWLLVFAAGVVAAYLPYAQFEVWTYLRFLLPAIAVAIAAIAGAAATSLKRVSEPARASIVLILLLAIAGANLAAARRHEVFQFGERQARARSVGERLAALLPADAVIVSGEQSGAMRYYTRRSILRWDLMDDQAMNDAVGRLRGNGYEVWVVLDDWEEELFRRRVPTVAERALNGPPVVQSPPGVGIRTRAWVLPL